MSTTAIQDWLAPFGAALDDLPGRELAWMRQLRDAARDRFAMLGWPTRKSEDWHYSDIRAITETTFTPAHHYQPASREVEKALANLPGRGEFHRLVFVNGLFIEPLSILDELPPGVRILSLANALKECPALVEPHLGRYALYESNPMTALNAALFRDGAFIHIPKGVSIDRPVEAIYLTTEATEPTAAHVRNLVVAEEGSEVGIVEVWHGAHDGTWFDNVVTEITAAPNATVRHVRIQEEGRNALHIADTKVHLRRDAQVSSHIITTGAFRSRNDLGFTLAEPGASCTLNGLFVLNGAQKADNQTFVDHASPHCTSHEFYKGVIDGQAEGSFTGRVLVRQDAQQTTAEQTNHNLLLSDGARINTRPQLEIYADDVKCSHGATSGQLDRDALFYLQSRGIDFVRARQILTRAFAAEIIDNIPIPQLKEHLLPIVEDRLCPGHLLEELT